MSHNKSEDESGDERDMNTTEINEIDDKVEESFEESVGNTTEKDEERSDPPDRLDGKNFEHCDQSDSSLELRDHLRNLPQELYDNIYDLTFTATPKSRIYFAGSRHAARFFKHMASVNEKLPHLLHVDRRSREKFAESYFGDPNSFLAVHYGSLTNFCVESRHLELVPELIYIHSQEANLCGIKLDLHDRGYAATVVERFKFMGVPDFIELLQDRVFNVTDERAHGELHSH